MSMRQDFKDSIRFLQRVAKNSYNSYNDAQCQTREATSNSSSRTTAGMLEAVARFADTEYNAVGSVLWKRLTDYKHRRHVLKSLIVIEYLLMRAGEQFVADVVERIDVIRRLKMFKYFKNGEEVGYEVRDQASRVMALLENFDDLMLQRQHLNETGQRLALPSTGYIFGEEGNQKKQQPLQLEYHYDNFGQEREEKFEFHNEPEHNDDDPVVVIDDNADADAEQEEEKPKKKRGKKLKRKQAKKLDDEDDFVEEKGGDQLMIVPVGQESNAVSALDDFLADLVNPKSNNAANEKSLVPASSAWENTQTGSHGQLGWLSSSMTNPVTNNELALFDTVENNPAVPVPRHKSVPEASLFDFASAHGPVAPAPHAQAPQPEYYNPYAARPAPAQGYYGYPTPPQHHHQPESQWNQLTLEYPAPANEPKKQHEDVFNWMN